MRVYVNVYLNFLTLNNVVTCSSDLVLEMQCGHSHYGCSCKTRCKKSENYKCGVFGDHICEPNYYPKKYNHSCPNPHPCSLHCVTNGSTHCDLCGHTSTYHTGRFVNTYATHKKFICFFVTKFQKAQCQH